MTTTGALTINAIVFIDSNTNTLLAQSGDGGIAIGGSGGLQAFGTVDLVTTKGGVSETVGFGIVEADAALIGNVVGDVVLGQINSVTLGNFKVSSGSFTLHNGGAFEVSGAVTASGNVTLKTDDLGLALNLTGSVTAGAGKTATLVASAGSIALSGTLDASSSGVVDLSAASGGISQSGGRINAGTLQSTLKAKAGATLTSSSNTIGTLAAFAVTAGNFALTDASALTISGAVKASGNVTLTDSATGTALNLTGSATTGAGKTATLVASKGDIALSGVLNATSTGVVDLSAVAGGISQSAGTITAGTLKST